MKSMSFCCPCCHKVEELEDASLAMHHICSNCWWQNDPSELMEYNSVDLEEAKSNYELYGACDKHGYWCKTFKELPEGVDERDPTAVARWNASK